MTEREQIEQQIREVLASESAAVVLSDRLFGPGGLFGRLANSEEERRMVAQSPLFKEAQRRLTELQEVEAEEFARAVQKAHAAVPRGEHLLKRKRAEIT
jgi:hypothetical protein